MLIHFIRSRKERPEMKEQKEKPLYDEMVEGLSVFVIRTADKDNPTPAELNAMVEITKNLFRTI